MEELISDWGPVVMSVLVAAGAFGWLRERVKGLRLIRRLNAEQLVDVLADRLVAWAEKYSSRTGGLSGKAKRDLVKGRMAERLGGAQVRAPEGELEEAVEAAHSRMVAAEAMAASAGAAGSGATGPDFPAGGSV